MRFTTTVRLQPEDAGARPLAGLKVELYDKDIFSSDDLLGTATTDERGEAQFHYDSEDFVSWEERLTGSAYPTLYARVYGPDGSQVASTRAESLGNTAARTVVVRIPASALTPAS